LDVDKHFVLSAQKRTKLVATGTFAGLKIYSAHSETIAGFCGKDEREWKGRREKDRKEGGRLGVKKGKRKKMYGKGKKQEERSGSY